MAQANETKRLTAILALRWRGAEAEAAIRPALARKQGRVLQTRDDGLVVEFASVTDAVACVPDAQDQLAASGPEAPTIAAGVHLGEVAGAGAHASGPAIDVAWQLCEAAGPQGGTLLSQAARTALGQGLAHPVDDAGEIAIAGAAPVRAFRLRVLARKKPAVRGPWWRWPAAAAVVLLLAGAGWYAWTERPWETREPAATPGRFAYPLPERPSFAVLAFRNASGDPAQDVLADGMAETIIAALSKSNAVFVVAREASFGYRGKTVPVAQVSEELGVRYVIDGSFARRGDRFAVNARTVDALTGRIVWTGQYDHEGAGFFAISDEIVVGAITGIKARLSTYQREQMLRRETTSLDAWLLWRTALPLIRSTKLEDVQSARDMLQRALKIDSDYISAKVMLARAFATEARGFLRGNSREMFRQAEELLDQASEVDANRAETWAEMAYYRIQRGDAENGIAPAERALTLDPNNWANLELLGVALHRLSRHADAIQPLRRAWRLNPEISNATVSALGRALMFSGQTEQAINVFNTVIKRNPPPDDLFPVHAWLAVIYYERGDEQRARDHLGKAREIRPDLRAEYFRRNFIFKDTSNTLARWISAWRRLGLPD